MGISFGEYELLRRLGSGGMAEVFLAKRFGPKGFQKRVVIKRILPHLSSEERFRSLFLAEARTAALIDHPNLAHVSDFGLIGEVYYLAMEYVDGLTIRQILAMTGPLSPGLAARVGVDLLQALQAIHNASNDQGQSLGLVHRDLTPRNVMVTRDGVVKLLDLGLASPTLPEGKVLGTKRYMAPEQARGEAIDARADIFCAALLLSEMITSERPLPESMDRPAERPPEFPEALWKILAPALALDPAERPSTVRSLLTELELYAGSRGVEGTRGYLAELVESLAPQRKPSLLRTLERLTRITRIPSEVQAIDLAPTPVIEILPPTAAFVEAAYDATDPAQSRRPRSVFAGHSWPWVLGLLTACGAVAWLGLQRSAPPQRIEPARAIVLAPQRVEALDPVIAVPDAGPVAQTDRPLAGPKSASAERRERRTAPRRAARSETRSRKNREEQRAKAAAHGWLTIDSQPWSEVYLEGRRLGTTPLEGVSLPAGSHRLELRNPELGLEREFEVVIESKRTTRVRPRL